MTVKSTFIAGNTRGQAYQQYSSLTGESGAVHTMIHDTHGHSDYPVKLAVMLNGISCSDTPVEGSVDHSWFICEAAMFVAVHMVCGKPGAIRHCTLTWARQIDAVPKVADSNPTRNQMVSGYLPTTMVYLE